MTPNYMSKIILKYNSTESDGICDDEIVPDENITFECSAHDLTTTQLFNFFGKFALAIGHNEFGIGNAACHLSFNEMKSIEDMRKIADNYDLILKEDFFEKINEYENEVNILTKTIVDLRSKLTDFENLKVSDI